MLSYKKIESFINKFVSLRLRCSVFEYFEFLKLISKTLLKQCYIDMSKFGLL